MIDVNAMQVREELLSRGDELVSFRQLVERFDDVDADFDGVAWNLEQIYSNFNVLIGEKPCNDCVSREAVCKALPAFRFRDITAFRNAKAAIEGLPAANPKRVIGYWIEHLCEAGKSLEHSMFECSVCHEWAHDNGKYCTHCGIEMSETVGERKEGIGDAE